MFTKNVAASNKTKIFASQVGLLLVLILLMTGITPASGTTTVSISPSTQIISQGPSFTINVSIEPDTAIAGQRLEKALFMASLWYSMIKGAKIKT